MVTPNRPLRWIQIILTLFYGQVLSTGIYEYFIQGVCGLLSHIRPTVDSVILLVLALLMFAFVLYALVALWYCRTRMAMVSVAILMIIFSLTLIKSILEIRNMGRRPIRAEWMAIRVTELVLRALGIVVSILFIIRLRKGYRPENF